jgi:hypothetical protein
LNLSVHVVKHNHNINSLTAIRVLAGKKKTPTKHTNLDHGGFRLFQPCEFDTYADPEKPDAAERLGEGAVETIHMQR